MAIRSLLAAGVVAATISFGGTAGASPDGPTCSNVLEIEVHGQHIIGDYVAEIGHPNLAWPPRGVLGDIMAGDGVKDIKGGPGPGFHFVSDIPPGASFCNPQANSVNAIEHQQGVP